jgi:hypothetical protein
VPPRPPRRRSRMGRRHDDRPVVAAPLLGSFSPISEGFRASFRGAGTWHNSGAPPGQSPRAECPYRGTGARFPLSP